MATHTPPQTRPTWIDDLLDRIINAIAWLIEFWTHVDTTHGKHRGGATPEYAADLSLLGHDEPTELIPVCDTEELPVFNERLYEALLHSTVICGEQPADDREPVLTVPSLDRIDGHALTTSFFDQLPGV